MSLMEIHRDLPYDTLVFPMEHIQPFFPYNITMFNTHKENPTQQYQVHFSFVLETPFLDQEDKAVAVVINSIKTDSNSPNPLEDLKTFKFLLQTHNKTASSVSNFPMNASES